MKRLFFYLTCSICILFLGCASSRTFVRYSTADMPFTLDVVKGSRQTVLTQTLPWEEQMMGYFKVLKLGSDKWQMWYSSWDNRRKDDYSDYLVYAHSTDGEHWIKEVPGQPNNILRGTGHPQKDGIVEQDVFIEPAAVYPYKMIYTAKDSTDKFREKTFIEESKDGLHWVNKRVLWNEKHDSQFSVIRRDNRYYIYLRHWEMQNNIRYRTIGLAVTDINWNTLVAPHNILTADFSSDFPHLYNPAAANVSADLDVLFPTFFNEKNNAIKFGLAYMYKGQPILTSVDLTSALLDGAQANWGIVAPGLVAAGKDTYWLYYYATNMVHSDYDKGGRKFSYYRVKLRLKEK
ncbi:hypothetical protein [Flavisolibacter nicotianae]|uniref:hypothetical protein n=1 Tax=Flavisolibacter nicotianae TaxID=2364882 RepID=UPI0013C4E606|nr:hypothetical protein [Flavisolibacter nicotianae]